MARPRLWPRRSTMAIFIREDETVADALYLWQPFSPPDMTADSAGSTATISASMFSS